jgi:hypothetical protein
MLVAYDGINYTTNSFSLANVTVGNVTSLQRLSFGDVEIPPYKFKLMLKNKTDVTLPASGSLVKYSTY